MSSTSLAGARDQELDRQSWSAARSGTAWIDALPLLGLALATIAFFWPMLRPLGQRLDVVDGDFSNQFYPFRVFAGQEWWSRRIPLWNPWVYGGHPFQADVQTAVFYPLATLNAIAWGKSGLPFFALEGEIVVHTFLAAAFMYLLARKVVGNVPGSLVAAVAFGFGGFVTSYPAQQLAILETFAWLPLIVLTLELALDQPVAWRWLMASSAVFGLAILAGHPQTDLFIVYAIEGYLLFRLIRSRVRRTVGLAALGLFPVLAVAVAAIQILPTIEFFTQSARVRMDFAAAAHGYLLSALPEIFVPLWHGEKALSIGVVALVFAVVGAVVSRREPLAYWTVAGIVAIPLSTGGATPLFWLLYVGAPGWNLFRDQERVICIFSFAGALLAARGVAAVADLVDGARLTRAVIAVAGAGALLSLVAIAVNPTVGDASGLRSSLVVDAVALALLAAMLVARARVGHFAAPLAALVVLLVAGESFAINQGNNLGPVSPDPRPRLAATAAFMRGFPEPFRVKALNEALFPSDWGAILGTAMITGDTPFTTQRADEMLSSNPDYKVWQLLNLKFFVTDGGPLGGLKPVFHDGSITTYFLEDSLPRAWAVTSYVVARNAAEAKAMILAPSYHPGNIVVLEQPPAIGPIPTGPRPDVKITHLDPQRIAIDTSAAQNSMLVLADAYYPGWNAYRDGTMVPVYRANYLTMAFDLPAGQHHYEIVYQPWPFYVGAAMTLAGLALLAFVAQRTIRLRPFSLRSPIALAPFQTAGWLLGIAVVLGVAFALRLHDLALPNLTGDEWFMLRNHDEGVAWIVHQAHTFEPHPLLYYVGLAGWIELAGRGEFAMRFPSAAFGVVLAAALIRLGHDLLGRRAGLLAGAFAALNPYQIAESQNARNYEMVAATSAVASVLFLHAVNRNRWRDWIAYAVAMLVALNVHYDAALVLAAHVAFFLGTRVMPRLTRGRYLTTPRSPDLTLVTRRWVGATAIVTLGFVAWLAYAWPALAAYHGYFPTPIGIDRVLARSLATFTLGSLAGIRQAIPAFALAVIALGWLLWARRTAGVFLALYVLLPIVAVSALFIFRPMYDERYLIVLAPGYLVVLAAGVELLWRRGWAIGLLGGVAAIALVWPFVGQTYASQLTDRPDYRSMARWVSAHGAAGDPIVATGYGQAELFGYYYRGPQSIAIVDDPAKLAAAPTLVGAHSGLWLLPFWHSDADNAALASLEAVAVPVAEGWFQNARALYFGSAVDLKPVPVGPATWDEVLSLSSAAMTRSELRPGEAVDAELHWDVAGPMPTPKLSLRLFDPGGALVGQTDLPLASANELAAGRLIFRLGVFVPPASPPGRYTVGILPYAADSGKALALKSDVPQEAGSLILGAVDVGTSDRVVPAEEAGVDLMPSAGFPAGLSLLGHDPIPPTPAPGSPLQFRLLWRLDRPTTTDVARTIGLRDRTGQVVAARADPILSSFPTSKWSAQQLLAERVSFKVPASIDSGTYAVTLQAGPNSPTVSLGTISVVGPERVRFEPTVGKPVGARFDPFATLARADVVWPTATADAPARFTLVWQARATADRPYTVFVHVLGADGTIVAQVDRQPAAGQRPTDSWVSGEFISDQYDLTIPARARNGPLQVEVGLYDPTTGARLPVRLANGATSDRVVVASLSGSP